MHMKKETSELKLISNNKRILSWVKDAVSQRDSVFYFLVEGDEYAIRLLSVCQN